jgi:hypothetical protein
MELGISILICLSNLLFASAGFLAGRNVLRIKEHEEIVAHRPSFKDEEASVPEDEGGN